MDGGLGPFTVELPPILDFLLYWYFLGKDSLPFSLGINFWQH